MTKFKFFVVGESARAEILSTVYSSINKTCIEHSIRTRRFIAIWTLGYIEGDIRRGDDLNISVNYMTLSIQKFYAWGSWWSFRLRNSEPVNNVKVYFLCDRSHTGDSLSLKCFWLISSETGIDIVSCFKHDIRVKQRTSVTSWLICLIRYFIQVFFLVVFDI